MKVLVSGRYRLLVGVPGQEPRIDTGWFDNIVTDAGLNRMGTGAWLTQCSVGTGNTAPSASDTALAAFLASTTTILSESAGAQSSAPYYGYRLVRYEFVPGAATGNLSEVGVGWSGGLFSRSLTVDEDGDPTTVTVLASEGLHVLYEVRLYPPLTDYDYTATIVGVSTTCKARAADVTNGGTGEYIVGGGGGWGVSGSVAGISTYYNATVYNGALGAITSSPGGTSSSSTSEGNAEYINNSYYRDMSATWSTTAGNLSGGITAVVLRTTGVGAYQISFDPPIPKTVLESLILNFRVSWGRLP